MVCARVYHLHFIVAVKSLAKGDDKRAMSLQQCAPQRLQSSGPNQQLLASDLRLRSCAPP